MSHLTIIGRAGVEKVLLVIEVSLSIGEGLPNPEGGGVGRPGFVRDTVVRLPWRWGSTLWGLLMKQKSDIPVRAMNTEA